MFWPCRGHRYLRREHSDHALHKHLFCLPHMLVNVAVYLVLCCSVVLFFNPMCLVWYMLHVCIHVSLPCRSLFKLQRRNGSKPSNELSCLGARKARLDWQLLQALLLLHQRTRAVRTVFVRNIAARSKKPFSNFILSTCLYGVE